MITDTREKILSIIRNRGQARVSDLARELGLSTVAIHKQLKRLLTSSLIEKRGVPPVVYYVPKIQIQKLSFVSPIPDDIQDVIEKTYLAITPDGHMLEGVEGFAYWAGIYGKDKNIEDLAQNYADAIAKQKESLSLGSWLDATSKLQTTFPDSSIKRLLFSEVYSIPVFGRTKLAKLVMHAKTSQDGSLIHMIADLVKPTIDLIIKTHHIQAVGYIPPTVPRPMQFMAEFARDINLHLPVIELSKVMPGTVAVPQKSLTSTGDRVINARESIYPKKTDMLPYKHILLIDDVAGSGASFNETARKLVPLLPPDVQITAYAIVGNIKGYEVIRQI